MREINEETKNYTVRKKKKKQKFNSKNFFSSIFSLEKIYLLFGKRMGISVRFAN